jgi:hypothetical protein
VAACRLTGHGLGGGLFGGKPTAGLATSTETGQAIRIIAGTGVLLLLLAGAVLGGSLGVLAVVAYIGLSLVAGRVSGSEIVMGYGPTPPYLDELGAQFLALFRQLAAQSGEPMDASFAPSEAEAMTERCGLSVVENVGGRELHERYFADRSDCLSALAIELFLMATVS